MNFKEVLLVVNPVSGDIEKDKIVHEVQRQLKKFKAGFHLYKTTGDNDIFSIQQKVEDKRIERIIVAGGDGTINIVAEAVKSYDLSIGIIPAGSANGLAVNLCMPKNLQEQVSVALGNKFIDLDILCLNDIICLHMSDLGINAELIKNYASSTIRGKFGYLLQSVPTLIKSEYPFSFQIQTENEERTETAVLLGIANARKYGTGANVNPKGKPNDGIFEILIFRKLNFMEILKTLKNEVKLDPDIVEIIHAKRATITSKKAVAFQIDGEFIGNKTSIEVKIMEEKLKIAIPDSCN